MVPEDQIKQLHDKSTHDQPLSSEEHSLLEEWYAFQDHVEHVALDLTMNKSNWATLHAQIENLLNQLTIVTKRIQEISTENGSLKQEITRLYRQLQGPV
jgi:hypothetical protein